MDAREGRGAGNGRSQAWYNSPLWENTTAGKKQLAVDIQESTEKEEPVSDDELDYKERIRRAQRFAY